MRLQKLPKQKPSVQWAVYQLEVEMNAAVRSAPNGITDATSEAYYKAPHGNIYQNMRRVQARLETV